MDISVTPDPRSVRTVADLATRLRELKTWTGNPSFEELRRRTGVPRSTLADALRPDRRRPPSLDVVRRIVRACGVDPASAGAWEAAWRRVVGALVPVAERHHVTLLPPDVGDLPGRDLELVRLDGLAQQASGSPVVVTGAAGVGKTALVLRWAHRRRLRYPDGHLYFDLRARKGDKVAPAQVAREFLRAMGATEADLHSGDEACLARFRSTVYARRTLIVLDDAADAAQVLPLLPGGPLCSVVVTSRHRLDDLAVQAGGRLVTVGSLEPAAGESLLVTLTGADRGDPLVADVVRLCGASPLLLRAAAAWLSDRPDRSLRTLRSRLERGQHFAVLSRPDESCPVRQVFASWYGSLPERARDLVVAMAAGRRRAFAAADLWLVGRDAPHLLEQLVACHALVPVGRGRYALHELLRRYVRECVRR
ncbi:helix-turn-helix domain-containing protein [Antribacter gilvus]|uniref:helix-turn-helix domain-containing protein n=1 Tax=Antribacter gilvus TaxID=2304675 RepID=UPI0013E0E759|nr:helix-turn-helix domain-containing protein [Antribacter gilvus]